MSLDERITERTDDQLAAKATEETLLSVLDEAGHPRMAMHTENANLCGELVLSTLRKMGLLTVEIDVEQFTGALDEVRIELLRQ